MLISFLALLNIPDPFLVMILGLADIFQLILRICFALESTPVALSHNYFSACPDVFLLLFEPVSFGFNPLFLLHLSRGFLFRWLLLLCNLPLLGRWLTRFAYVASR